MTRRRSITFALLAGSISLTTLGGCSRDADDVGVVSADDTVALSGMPRSTPPVTPAATATTVVSTTTTTTTIAPTTTAAPPTTLPPTTTVAPTTTTTLPPNVEIVGRFEQPVEAVGERDGAATQVLQMRLTQLGFWHAGADGEYGFTTTQAVMAFQKYIGLPPTGEVDPSTASYLTEFPERAHGVSDAGTLVEIDLRRQLLFIIVEGKTVWTFNTSTGTGQPYEEINKKDPTKIEKGNSITPEGLFRTNRERPEGWWEGDLGEIYRPKYFKGGVAIHGMTSVPGYPASHGCVRVSTGAMDFIWDANLVPLGTIVWVHT